MLPRRVVVTGLSVATALGFEPDAFWRNLLAGASGISRAPFVPDDLKLGCRNAGLIDRNAFQEVLQRANLSDPDFANQLALYVGTSAMRHAGLPVDGSEPRDFEVLFGTGHGNVLFHNEALEAYIHGGPRKLRPTSVVRTMLNRPANLLSIALKLTGASYTMSSACATGSIVFGEAFNHIRFGLTDGVLAACSDSGLDLPTFVAWNRLGVLSKIEEPAAACRPFDQGRDGLIMGEGAAAFVLESLDAARARGATILAEVAGCGTSCDATHIVQPDSRGQVRALRKAMECANITPDQLGYINAHGTATELADVAEAETLREALGEEHARRIPVSNTKAQLGHLMGATAGVELAVSILALRNGLLPPSRNLDAPDPRCPLNFVRGEPMELRADYVLKNSFAFGGTNSVVILKQFTD